MSILSRNFWNPWDIINDNWGFTMPSYFRNFPGEEGNTLGEVKYDKDKFQVMVDIQQFKPEEVNVKVVDNYLVIDAKHEEKPDEHGYISRQFTRRYLLPETVKGDQIQCNLSSDGVLMLSAPVNMKENERLILDSNLPYTIPL